MTTTIKSARLYARRVDYNRGVELAMAVPSENPERVAFAEPLVLQERGAWEEGQPFLRLSTGQAQELMDELWSCGLRPTEGSGSAGSLAATEKHLADMRAIAFGALKLEGKAP